MQFATGDRNRNVKVFRPDDLTGVKFACLRASKLLSSGKPRSFRAPSREAHSALPNLLNEPFPASNAIDTCEESRARLLLLPPTGAIFRSSFERKTRVAMRCDAMRCVATRVAVASIPLGNESSGRMRLESEFREKLEERGLRGTTSHCAGFVALSDPVLQISVSHSSPAAKG